MASKKDRKKSKPKETGVEPFEPEEDENVNGEESEEEDEDSEDNEEDEDMAKNKARKRREEEDDDAEDEVDVESEEDEDEDDEEEDEPVEVGFAPYIIHDEAEWALEDVIDGAEPGETIYFYRAPTEDSPTAKWYKLEPISVGELPV